MRKETLTAYGTLEHREMLQVLAEQSGDTASTWIIRQIQREYERQFGNTPPASLRKPA